MGFFLLKRINFNIKIKIIPCTDFFILCKMSIFYMARCPGEFLFVFK